MDEIRRLREDLELIDHKIIQALLERKGVSWQLQHAKVAAGDSRVDLAQEAQVIKRYDEGLTDVDGRVLAHHILNLCRGYLRLPNE